MECDKTENRLRNEMEYSKRLEDHITEQTKQIKGLTTENLSLKEENEDFYFLQVGSPWMKKILNSNALKRLRTKKFNFYFLKVSNYFAMVEENF